VVVLIDVKPSEYQLRDENHPNHSKGEEEEEEEEEEGEEWFSMKSRLIPRRKWRITTSCC
jgi:hypothetical protein